MPLTDRASLLRAFFRLVNSGPQDEALTEHDANDEAYEGVYLLLEEGAWDAQHWMIEAGWSDRWLTTVDFPDHGGTGADSDWQGADSTDGGRWAALPEDFLRLAGDRKVSALHEPDGTRWGKLMDHRDRFRVTGNRYWLQGEDLWIASGASPPSDLKLDYHQRIAVEDNETVDFPAADRKLIVAFAAAHGMEENWLPGGDEMKQSILKNLERRMRQSWKRARRHAGPRKMRPKRVVGTHWIIN